jgi:hypothetical protein
VSEPQNFRAGYYETCIIVEYIFEGYGSTVTHVMYVASFNGFCAALMLLQILVRYPVGHATSMAVHSFSHRYLETSTVWQYFQAHSYRPCSRVWCPDPGVCFSILAANHGLFSGLGPELFRHTSCFSPCCTRNDCWRLIILNGHDSFSHQF